MTVTLGGITLSDDLRINGLKNQPQVAGSEQMTLGGRMVFTSCPVTGGRTITLESFRSGDSVYGYFTGTQIDQIAALRDLQTTIALVHHLGTFQVKIKAINVEDVAGVADPSSTSEYTGTITMIEV